LDYTELPASIHRGQLNIVGLEGEMRKWEKTFPDELWKEFGRLTGCWPTG
jgi:hypothetical protein